MIESDSKDPELQVGEVLTEEKIIAEFRRQDPTALKTAMGAEAIRALLAKVDIDLLHDTVEEALENTKSAQMREYLVKHHEKRVIKAFYESRQDPTSMILDAVPVIPAELRPLVPLESGGFAIL